MASEINWHAIGQAERQLIVDTIAFENEMIRIDCTTYDDKDKYRLIAVQGLRAAIDRYSNAIRKAAPEIVL